MPFLVDIFPEVPIFLSLCTYCVLTNFTNFVVLLETFREIIFIFISILYTRKHRFFFSLDDWQSVIECLSFSWQSHQTKSGSTEVSLISLVLRTNKLRLSACLLFILRSRIWVFSQWDCFWTWVEMVWSTSVERYDNLSYGGNARSVELDIMYWIFGSWVVCCWISIFLKVWILQYLDNNCFSDSWRV